MRGDVVQCRSVHKARWLKDSETPFREQSSREREERSSWLETPEDRSLWLETPEESSSWPGVSYAQNQEACLLGSTGIHVTPQL